MSGVTSIRAEGASDPPIVRLQGLAKRFTVRRSWGDLLRGRLRREWVRVLDGVSFEVRPGELFGLLGPNGAGKTTLFKILSTLVLPDSGSASVASHDVVREAAHVRRLLTPVVADERSLFWRLDALENMALFAGLYGAPRGRAIQQSRALLERVGLDDTGHKLVGTFSSGMKQRLLIARALLSSPRVLLLDEPTRSLDPLSARDLRRFLRDELIDRQGCTILLATHNAEEALTLCDRVAVLHRGRLQAVGPVAELASGVAGERYALVARPAARDVLAGLQTSGTIRALAAAPGEDGWSRFELELAGGAERASGVLAAVVGAGVPVARLERVDVSLPELLERLAAGAPDA